MPISLRIGVPIVLLAGGWFGYQAWRQSRTVIRFEPAAGIALPDIELTFYPEEFSFAAPSPPDALGSLSLRGSAETVVGSDLVPGSALMRYAGKGIGTGFTRVVRGRPNAPIALTGEARLSGHVGVQDGFFAFGLRGSGSKPVAGARVLGLGGGEHGVVLCEATSDADGHFVLSGFAGDTACLAVRVLAPGYAIASVTCQLPVADEVVVPLVETRRIEGAVGLPPEVPAASVRLLARGLPGVDCAIAADGTFVLDHVPPDVEPRLLVYGLDDAWTHPLVRAAAGDRAVRLLVVRAATVHGRIVDRQTHQPIGRAMVWHENGPAGMVAVDADENGRFELGRAPPGEIVVRAQVAAADPFGHSETRTGERRITIEAGKDVDGVVVGID